MESNSEFWFWNKSVNKTDSDFKEEKDDNEDKSNIKIEVPRIEQMVSHVVYKKDEK